MSNLSELTLVEKAPYIKGVLKTFGKSSYTPLDPEILQRFVDKIECNDMAKTTLKETESYQDFFNINVDFKVWFPKCQRDLFYAAKVGYRLAGVSPYLVWLITKALSIIDTPNYVPIQLGTSVLQSCFSGELLLTGVSLYDAICNVIDSSYTVLDEEHLVNKMPGYAEVYIPQEDMIAIVPTKIADMIDDNYIRSLYLTKDGLVGENNVKLKRLCGYKGVINSHYDLRNLI